MNADSGPEPAAPRPPDRSTFGHLPVGASILLTAEHGGNEVPGPYRALFKGRGESLASHRGWDPGSLALAERLASALGAPLIASRTTRLLVDLNRSPHNPRVFSEVTRGLPLEDRRALLQRWHRPHWARVGKAVDAAASSTRTGPVLHIAVHSFTPVLHGVVRRPDLSLLYDPGRPGERRLADVWTRALRSALPERAIRRNDPYRGKSDGLTTALRRRFGPEAYLGIEIEAGQKHLGPDGRFPEWVCSGLVDSLATALASEI